MSEKLSRCGCGGDVIILSEKQKNTVLFDIYDYVAICRDCKTNTRKCIDDEEATRVWNKSVSITFDKDQILFQSSEVMKKVNKMIYAGSIILGSEKYFKIRNLLCEKFKEIDLLLDNKISIEEPPS